VLTEYLSAILRYIIPLIFNLFKLISLHGLHQALLVLCASFLFSCTVNGQSALTDSLEEKLQKTKGKEKVDILNQLTYEFITIDNDKVVGYGKQALELSKKIKYLKGEARAYTYRGVSEYLSGQLPEGHRDLNIGLKLATRVGDEKLRGYTFLQLGTAV